MKKLVLLITALAATSGLALADYNDWDGSNGNWSDTSRWSLGGTPSLNNWARIFDGTVTMNSDNTADSNDRLYVGDDTGGGNAVLSIEAGANFLTDAYMFLGRGGSGTSTLNQTGGTSSIGSLKVGHVAGSGTSTVNVSGGTMGLSGSYIEVAYAVDATVNVNGGTLNATGDNLIVGKSGTTGALNLSSGTFSSAGLMTLGWDNSTSAGSYIQTGGAADIAKVHIGRSGSSSTFYISGGSLNVANYLNSWATGVSTFEVDGSGATDIEIGQLVLSTETFRINLDSGGSTLVEVDSEGSIDGYDAGLDLSSAVFELGGAGFDDTVGTVYDIAWAVDGIDTTGMTFVDNTGLTDGKSWQWNVVTADNGGVSGDMLRVTVIPEPATIGMFGIIGSVMLWVRRRTMI